MTTTYTTDNTTGVLYAHYYTTTLGGKGKWFLSTLSTLPGTTFLSYEEGMSAPHLVSHCSSLYKSLADARKWGEAAGYRVITVTEETLDITSMMGWYVSRPGAEPYQYFRVGERKLFPQGPTWFPSYAAAVAAIEEMGFGPNPPAPPTDANTNDQTGGRTVIIPEGVLQDVHQLIESIQINHIKVGNMMLDIIEDLALKLAEYIGTEKVMGIISTPGAAILDNPLTDQLVLMHEFIDRVLRLARVTPATTSTPATQTEPALEDIDLKQLIESLLGR